MKIWYINTFSKGNHHEIYNASILKLCTLCSDEVVAISDKKTLANYCELANIQDSGIHKYRQSSFSNKIPDFSLYYLPLKASLANICHL